MLDAAAEVIAASSDPTAVDRAAGEGARRRTGLAGDIVAQVRGRLWPSPPALTAVKVPGGGVAWPPSFRPQQAVVPLGLTPQVWCRPALTAVKAPAGGVAWPKLSLPQQARAPFVLTPQL